MQSSFETDADIVSCTHTSKWNSTMPRYLCILYCYSARPSRIGDLFSLYLIIIEGDVYFILYRVSYTFFSSSAVHFYSVFVFRSVPNISYICSVFIFCLNFIKMRLGAHLFSLPKEKQNNNSKRCWSRCLVNNEKKQQKILAQKSHTQFFLISWIWWIVMRTEYTKISLCQKQNTSTEYPKQHYFLNAVAHYLHCVYNIRAFIIYV